MRVLVVGGGIAGLALAQGMRKAGIDVTVYEQGRRAFAASWLQGYQIHINSTGAAALEACLASSARAELETNALRPTDGFQMLDEHLEELFVHRSDAFRRSRPIIRSALRRVLLTDLADAVRFEMRFTRYEPLSDGRVRAHFADGSSAVADVLVGADGVGSAVRRQYLPQARVTDLGLVGMAGLIPLEECGRAHVPEALRARLTSVLASDGLYAIVTQSIHKDVAQAWPAEEADHLIWVLITPRTVYGENAKSMFDQGPALKELALGLMQRWHPHLRRLVEITDPAVVSATAVQSAEPVRPWPTTNVTLVGDAVHTMPPLQGLGGSTALRDAALLSDRLVRAARGELEILPAIHAYETEMLDYGFAAVAQSERFTRMIAATRNPGFRQVFRTMLRLARVLPPISRRLFSVPRDGPP